MAQTDATLELCEQIVADCEWNQHFHFLVCEAVCDSIVYDVERRAETPVHAHNPEEWFRETLTDINEELCE